MDYTTLNKLIEGLNLEVIYESTEIDNIKITGNEINRIGLQLAGYFDRFAYKRFQIIGNVEWHFCRKMSQDLRYERLEKLFSYSFPTLIFSRDLEVFPESLELAEKYDRTILRTKHSTTKFINILINHLNDVLAPSTTLHGVLVEVYGMGILIIGESGVGKSETALELIKRGHRLVADDAVEVKKVDERLRGGAPDLIRHFIEIRGIGILDVERLYGVGSVKENEFIDLIIELEFWDESKEYDRIGLDEEYMNLLGIDVPRLIIPVRPGRNLAMIVEVAARNTRQKNLGYNAAEELNNKIKEEINKRKNTVRNNED